MSAPRLTLSSEFGSVAVEVDTSANGPRLRVEDLRSGRVIHLDPLELASLTWLTHDRLGPFLDPSQTGWSRERNGAGAAERHDSDAPPAGRPSDEGARE